MLFLLGLLEDMSARSLRGRRVVGILLLGLSPLVSACTTFDGIPDVAQGGTGAAADDNGAPGVAGAGGASATAEAATSGGPSGATTGSSGAGGASGSVSSAATGSAAATTAAASTTGASTGAGPMNDPAGLCVDTINQYRATLRLPPLARWADKEACAGDEARKDFEASEAHSAFGQCGELAQNECPGWPAPEEKMITDCLAQMWAEGPGRDFSKHGHFINMSSTQYTKVACGFTTTPNGSIWAAQDFQ